MEKVNKWMAMTIAGAVAIVSFLFLPMISQGALSVSFFDMLEAGGELEFKGIIMLVLILGGSGLAAAGGWLKNKNYAFSGPLAAAAGLLLFLFGNDAGVMDAMEVWGFGLWLSIIAIIVNVVLAFQLKKED